MPTLIATQAREKSTIIINCAFSDEDGDAVVPKSITWTLSDSSGTAINSRTDVEVAAPAASIDIVLYGLDLAIQVGETDALVKRRLTIEAVVDTDAGNDLPVKEEAVFLVENLLNVA